MLNATPAGAETTSAPASSRLRRPTFGDWVQCGDIQKTYLVADASAAVDGNASIDMVTDPESVAAWVVNLSGQDAAEIAQLTMQQCRPLVVAVNRAVPSFADCKPEGGTVTANGVSVPLSSPVMGMRDKISHLHLRLPTAADWISCGDITVQRVAVDQADLSSRRSEQLRPKKIEQRLDRGRVNRWMMALTGQPEAILHLLDYDDARRVFAYLKALIAVTDEGN